MPKFTITSKSSTFENEVQSKALELFNSGKSHGVLFGSTSVFIDYKPRNAITVFAGIGVLEGKKLYVGN